MSDTAREAVQALVNGTAEQPASGLGDWQAAYDDLWGLYTTGGKEKVRTVVSGDRKLRTLLAQGGGGVALSTDATLVSYPPLPAAATAVYQHQGPCGHWLDDYVQFAQEAAPMAPRNLHESAGLFAVSAAIARRLVLHASMEAIHPNLYVLFLAPSTIYTKSTALKIIEQVLHQARLSHLLLPQRATPQALVNDLSEHKLPTKHADLEMFLQRRAFAARRSYIRDEVSSLFVEMRREYNAGLLELLLELYNCRADFTEMTISRGDITVSDSYMSFLGISTPSEMSPHLANPTFWSNGLWTRFALLTPDESPRYAFYPQQIGGLDGLASRLRAMYDLFPEPRAELTHEDDEQGKSAPVIRVYNKQSPRPAQLAPGVWDAWAAYHRACYDVIQAGSLAKDLHPNYGRFATMAIKTAMVLAVMDGAELPVVVSLAHYARAQQIVEGWRASLHHIWEQQAETEDETNARRIYDWIRQHGGATSRLLQQRLHIHARPVREALQVLEESGQVEQVKQGRTTIWRAV
jgi:hypothetical protein